MNASPLLLLFLFLFIFYFCWGLAKWNPLLSFFECRVKLNRPGRPRERWMKRNAKNPIIGATGFRFIECQSTFQLGDQHTELPIHSRLVVPSIDDRNIETGPRLLSSFLKHLSVCCLPPDI